MNNHLTQRMIVLSILLTLLIMGASSYFSFNSLWGINHLTFLPSVYTYIYMLAFIGLMTILIIRKYDNFYDSLIDNIALVLWGRGPIPRLILTVIALALFVIFPVKVHLLGDGYTWLSIFGGGEAYIHKFSEPGSIYLIRFIQDLLGGYTGETALLTFRIISVVSGGIFVYNIIVLIERLFSGRKYRILALSSILFAGSILLFFGYVEFYPLLWAVLALTLNYAVRFIKTGDRLIILCLCYLAALLVHLQAVIFLPGILYIIIQKIENKTVRKSMYTLLLLGILSGWALMIYLYNTRVDFEVLILPLINGRPFTPDYSVFSLPHFYDIINLSMVVFPGGLVILVLWLVNGAKIAKDTVGKFLLILSIFSLAFLMIFGAGVTMGRDWDIMSLSLLAPMLLLLYFSEKGGYTISGKTIISYILLTAFCTIAYLSVSIGTQSAENRFYTLLNNRQENSWAIYANYFNAVGNTERFKEIMNEKARRFPDTQHLDRGYEYLESGQNDKAREIAKRLIEQNPYNPSYCQFMGNVLGKYKMYDSALYYFGRAEALEPYNSGLLSEYGQLYIEMKEYDRAIELFTKARKLAPDNTAILEGLGLAYIYKQDYDRAKVAADTLFMSDKNSPGGSLIMMSVYLRNGNYSQAAQYYRLYLQYGRNRSDYQNIKEYYKNLEGY